MASARAQQNSPKQSTAGRQPATPQRMVAQAGQSQRARLPTLNGAGTCVQHGTLPNQRSGAVPSAPMAGVSGPSQAASSPTIFGVNPFISLSSKPTTTGSVQSSSGRAGGAAPQANPFVSIGGTGSASRPISGLAQGSSSAKAVGSPSTTLTVPLTSTNRYYPAKAPYASSPQSRSKGSLNQVIDGLLETGKNGSVTNPRYEGGTDGPTYCNIFVSDFTRAMGAEIPHVVTGKDGKPHEQTASDMNDWLRESGPANGWKRVDAQTAQDYANEGKVAVASAKDIPGYGAHIAALRPGTDSPSNGPTIANVGAWNNACTHVRTTFTTDDPSVVEYFVHD